MIQKIHATSKLSTMTPDSGSPIPPPIPKIALTSPSPVATRSGGNVSRTMPKASGNTPPATPWITRPTSSSSIECAERAHHAAEREHEQHDGEGAALAVDVAELADDRRRDRGGEQEAGEHPRRRRGARAELAADRRQGRDDERLRQREADARQQQDDEDLGRMLRGSGGGHPPLTLLRRRLGAGRRPRRGAGGARHRSGRRGCRRRSPSGRGSRPPHRGRTGRARPRGRA